MFNNTDLDPSDWDEFSDLAIKFIQQEIRNLSDSTQNEVWQAVPDDVKKAIQNEPLPVTESDISTLISEYQQNIQPYRTGNTHPKFWGWVHGTGNVAALLADVATSAMNANCGGRDHAAIYIERQVLDWCKQLFGFSNTSSGILTSGTSHSSLMALQVALHAKFGEGIKRQGLASIGKTVRFYTSKEAHSSIKKAVEALGVGSDNLVPIETDQHHKIDVDDLRFQIQKDLDQGFCPTAIIANSGTVNAGAFDDLRQVKTIAQDFHCWLHVDGAFGAWFAITQSTHKHLVSGLELADSLAFDFHKFMSVQYDCAGLLIKDAQLHQHVFSNRPDYLAPHGQALAGGDPWFCDFGHELSRPFRALKVWFTFKTYGMKKLANLLEKSCDNALFLADLVSQSDNFELLMQPSANVVCFNISHAVNPKVNNQQCEQLVADLQHSGEAVFSLTKFGDYRYIRAAFVNQRTQNQHVQQAFERLLQIYDQQQHNTSH